MSDCNCKKDKCLSPAVLQINNQDCPTVFHKVTFPAAMGDDKTNPPRNGQYRNVLLVYEANGHVYMFSSDGIPTLISDGSRGIDDYNELTNKPSIEGHELVDDSSLDDIGVTDAIEDALEDYSPTSDLAEVAFSGDYNDLSNKPTIGNATLTIQKNGTAVDTFTANATSNKTINITVPTTAADVSALPASTKYGASISVSLNTTDYKMTTTLKDQDGNTLGTAQTVDLPLESVVVNGSYDNTNKKIILTLQNGNTVDIPVGDLVAGLQTEITSTNKLSSDLVDDTNHTNKFVTAAQIAKLNGIAAGAEVNVQSDWSVTDTTSDAFIKNKPTIPAAQVNSDWSANSGVAQILNKPSLATVATSGSYNDLSDKPTIPTVNDATLTITQNGASAGTFTANASSDTTISLTDTTYSDFSGATSSVAGASGLVPAPVAGDEDKALKGDGTWSVVGDVVELFVNKQPGSLSTPFKIYKDWGRTVPITHSEMRELFIPSNKKTVVLHDTTSYDGVYPVIEFCYDTTEFYIFDAINSATYYIVSAPGGGNTDFSITRTDLQRKLTAGSNITISGDTISASAKLVEMSYGESNAWAKFIAAYQAGSIVYCRASSNANPASGSQTRKAFMAYVNNAESPTSVEFQYVRSVSSKSASQPVDQVLVYTLTNASGGTWTVASRNMGPKLAAGTNTTVSYSNGTYTISATGGGGGGPTVVQTTGQSTTNVMSQKAVTDIIGNVETILQTLNSGNGAQQ